MVFSIALFAVLSLLLVAVPGYVLTKKNVIGTECIASLSKILLYVCQPCLAVYTFKSVLSISVYRYSDASE